MNYITSIAVRREIRNKLASLGKKDQTFDEIITSLLAKSEE